MATIEQVRKRDGSYAAFSQQKIADSIHRALFDANVRDGKVALKLATDVADILETKFFGAIPGVEQIQDIVEEVLEHFNRKVADLYREFREKKAEARKFREKFGIAEKLTYNALTVLERRYLLRNKGGKIIETPEQMFRRVARAIAAVEAKYPHGDVRKTEDEFFRMMSSLEFLPNSPTLFNAGAPLKQLAACFVLPVEDSLESIFKSVKDMALIEQSGGGVGFSFSRLRPAGDVVRSTGGVASGPVSFMRIFDTATDVIKAGGKRRGALMGVLNVNHPDILHFIMAKQTPGFLSNFNLSVAVTDSFLEAVRKNEDYELINPRTKNVAKHLNARFVWDLIVENAWKTGDPGVIFIDEINRRNPTAHIGPIESTNPCGEQPLHPYEACNLGSINLTKMVKQVKNHSEVDWEKLARTIKSSVRFLDDVIDANKFPIPEIQYMVSANRRIGLGIMGWADLLILLGIPYDSEKAISLAEKLMSFIKKIAHEESQYLGAERGNFPYFKDSIWDKKGYKHMRNAAVTTIAPTGTLSIIAGVSSGIEPLLAVSFVRKVLEGRRLLEANRIFERTAKEKGIYSTKLMMQIAKSGSVQKTKDVPADMRRLFVTALDIDYKWHVKMQAAFQKHTDNAVSKTVNFPRGAKVADVKKAYELAHKLKCKGVTIYRYGSKPEQVFYIGDDLLHAESEYAGGCPTGTCPL